MLKAKQNAQDSDQERQVEDTIPWRWWAKQSGMADAERRRE
jgi:hypothetical protein